MLKTTPLKELHIQFDAEFTEYYGYSMPGSYSELSQELAGLRQCSAAFDLCAFSRISVSGDEAEKLIRTALTHTQMPESESWSWASRDKKARILNTGNGYMLLIHPQISENVLDKLISHSSSIDATVTDRTDNTAMLGLYGPDAYETLGKMVPLDISNLKSGGVMSVSFFMMNFTVIRGSWLGADGVELICPVSASKFATQAVEKYQRRQAIIPAGTICFEAAFEEYISQTA